MQISLQGQKASWWVFGDEETGWDVVKDYRVLKKLLGIMERFSILTLMNFLVNVYIHKKLSDCLL